MPWLVIVVGAVLFFLGLGWLFRPEAIIRLSRLIKETVLNDNFMALSRRKWGFGLLLAGFFLLYFGLALLK